MHRSKQACVWLVDDSLMPAGLSAADMFEQLWSLPENWVEKPNSRRGGWSAVSTHTFNGDVRTYVKRQRNHCYRAIHLFGRLIPTARREWDSLIKLKDLGIPAPEAVIYGERRAKEGYQAVLITKALENYSNLTRALEELPSQEDRTPVIHAVVALLKRFHGSGIQHNSLSGEHIFMKNTGNGTWAAALIDLEKCRRSLTPFLGSARDLAYFLSHTPKLTTQNKDFLIQEYCSGQPAEYMTRLKDKITTRCRQKSWKNPWK